MLIIMRLSAMPVASIQPKTKFSFFIFLLKISKFKLIFLSFINLNEYVFFVFCFLRPTEDILFVVIAHTQIGSVLL